MKLSELTGPRDMAAQGFTAGSSASVAPAPTSVPVRKQGNTFDLGSGSAEYANLASVLSQKEYSGQEIVNAFYKDAKRYLASSGRPLDPQQVANTAFEMMKANGFQDIVNNRGRVFDNSENYWALQRNRYNREYRSGGPGDLVAKDRTREVSYSDRRAWNP